MRSWKRTAALLSLALLPVLAGCGGGEKAGLPTESSPVPVEETARYTAEFTPLRTGLRESVTPLCYTDSGFYAKVYERAGQRPLGLDVTEAYEGQYDLYEYRYYFVGADGSFRLLEDYSPVPAPENPGNYPDFESHSAVSGLFAGGNGELTVLETATVSYYAGPEELTENDDEYWQYLKTETHFYLRRLDENGKELSRSEPELADVLYAGEGCVPDGEGDLLITYTASTGESFVAALAEDGSVAYRLNYDGYPSGLAILSGGRPAVLGSLPSGLGLQLIDAKAKSFGKSYSLPEDALDLIPGNGKYDYYYSSGTRLYGCDLESGEKREILSWMDCDLNGENLLGVTVRPDGAVLAVENDWDGDTVTASLATLRETGTAPAAEKQVLTLAAVDLDYNARDAVIRFNRQSADTRIQVLDYSQYNASPGDSAGLTKLTTEILSGKLPDILALKGLPYDQLAAKGLLEDLYPWLDGDGALEREDFFPSVLHAAEVGGGLYQVCPYFSVTTAVGALDVVGDRTGWTYEDLYGAMAALPEGSGIFSPYATKSSVLTNCLAVNMDSLVDWTAGTCRFDSEDFLDLLDFAARFPDQPGEAEAAGIQLLRETSVNEFRNPAFDELYFGGEGSAVYIGYPTSDGSCGSAIDLDEGFAMSAACGNKEAAWEFLRVFLTADYQSNLYKLPSNRARFTRNLTQAMTPTYALDEQGNYVLDEKGERVQEPIVWFDGQPIYCTTQSQAERLTALVENCTKAVRPASDSILKIVLEDAQAFFTGQKSAREAADLIQSKVNLYMGEQR